MATRRDSFGYQSMCADLKAEPTWTPQMWCVYNDMSDELTADYVRMWNKDQAKSSPEREKGGTK